MVERVHSISIVGIRTVVVVVVAAAISKMPHPPDTALELRLLLQLLLLPILSPCLHITVMLAR